MLTEEREGGGKRSQTGDPIIMGIVITLLLNAFSWRMYTKFLLNCFVYILMAHTLLDWISEQQNMPLDFMNIFKFHRKSNSLLWNSNIEQVLGVETYQLKMRSGCTLIYYALYALRIRWNLQAVFVLTGFSYNFNISKLT